MNPYVAGMPWASTPPTYPGAYPWSGQPIKIVPAYAYFTPSAAFAPSAPELNAMFHQRDQAAFYNAAALAILGAIAAENWMGPVIVSTITNALGPQLGITTDPVWDAHGQRWLCLSNHTFSTPNEFCIVRSSVDGGRTWDDVGGVTFSTGAGHASNLAVKPSDGTILFTFENPSGGDFEGYSYTYSPATNTWTSHSTAPNSSSTLRSILAWFDAAGVFVCVARNLGTGHTLVATSPDGITWTDRTSGAGLGTFFPQAWASDGTRLIAFCDNLSTCYSTTDGVTWAAHSIAPMVANEIVNGAAYSAADGAFMVATYRDIYLDTTYQMLRSIDGGVTWTLASLFTGGKPQGLAALGNLWVTSVQGAPGGLDKTRVWYSSDAGVTWTMSAGGGIPSGVKVGGGSGVTSSGRQFMAWTCDKANGALITGQAAI